MNKKIALTVFAFMCIMLFLTEFNAYVAAVPRKPLAPQDLIFEEGKSANDVDNSEDSIAKVAYNTVILNQTFDDGRCCNGYGRGRPRNAGFLDHERV